APQFAAILSRRILRRDPALASRLRRETLLPFVRVRRGTHHTPANAPQSSRVPSFHLPGKQTVLLPWYVSFLFFGVCKYNPEPLFRSHRPGRAASFRKRF